MTYRTSQNIYFDIEDWNERAYVKKLILIRHKLANFPQIPLKKLKSFFLPKISKLNAFWYPIHLNLFFLTIQFNDEGEIIYRVELPDMEEITMIYLENSDADYCKSSKKSHLKVFSISSSFAFFVYNFVTSFSSYRYFFSSVQLILIANTFKDHS